MNSKQLSKADSCRKGLASCSIASTGEFPFEFSIFLNGGYLRNENASPQRVAAFRRWLLT
jgi:hypothetical protein